MLIPRPIYSLLLALAGSSLMAQIPNGSFELWEDHGGYTEPAGWLTYNDVLTPSGYFTTVEAGSPGAVGAHYAHIESRSLPDGGGVIQGWISAGERDDTIGGFAYSGRPAALTGQWQYGIMPGDTGVVMVFLRGPDLPDGTANLVASASHEFTGTQSGWAAFNVPLTYYNNDAPFRAYIQFEASKDFALPTAGSFIKLDDLGFAGWVGVAEPDPRTAFLAYPSPAANVLHLEAAQPMAEVAIVDLSGRTLLHRSVASRQQHMDVSRLAAGSYVVRIRWADGSVSAKAFSKE